MKLVMWFYLDENNYPVEETPKFAWKSVMRLCRMGFHRRLSIRDGSINGKTIAFMSGVDIGMIPDSMINFQTKRVIAKVQSR